MLELLFFEKELLDLKNYINFVVLSNFLLSFELYIYIYHKIIIYNNNIIIIINIGTYIFWKNYFWT